MIFESMLLAERYPCKEALVFISVFIVFKETGSFMIEQSSCKQYPCLIFRDDFNKLDFQTWEHLKTAAYTGNKEFQYYTNNRTNSYIKNGVLYLKPTLTNDTYGDDFLVSGELDLWGNDPGAVCTSNRYEGCFRKGTNSSIINPVQSAGITTAKSFSFKYGKINIRAKLPQGDWLWPALWLMPKYQTYGEWPASGEIDIMESRGNAEYYSQNKSIGNNNVQQVLHWGPYCAENRHELTSVLTLKEKGSYVDDFNIFSVSITPEGIYFYINGNLTLNVTVDESGFWGLGNFEKNLFNPWSSGSKMAPFDQEFYIIMNLAVGGNNGYFHQSHEPSAPWDNNEQDHGKVMKQFWDKRKEWLPTWEREDTALKIDYVEVWIEKKDLAHPVYKIDPEAHLSMETWSSPSRLIQN